MHQKNQTKKPTQGQITKLCETGTVRAKQETTDNEKNITVDRDQAIFNHSGFLLLYSKVSYS